MTILRSENKSTRIEPYRYPGEEGAPAETAGWQIWHENSPAQQPNGESAEVLPPAPHPVIDCEPLLARQRADHEQQLQQAINQTREEALAQGREQGRQQEREMQRTAALELESRLRRQSADLITSFTLERDRYLREVEAEVVQLALHIAARILRREAQMDPLLLTGAVRVALGQLAEATEVRIIVPSEEQKLWIESLGLVPNLPLKPTVVADDELQLGECRIESALGTVDLGLGAQLAEIERGFFDSGARTRRAHGKTEAVAALRERY